MNKRVGLIAAAALGLLSTMAGAAPPAGGTISVEAQPADAELGRSMPSFVSAADEALATKGFTILEEPGHAAFVAELSLSRVRVGTGSAKVPVDRAAVIPGDSPDRVGAGIRIPLSTGKSQLVPLQKTRLQIRIRKRGEENVLWQSTAITVRAAGTRKGQDDTVASDLFEALLRDYPAQPRDVIGVP
jgi:hypothetical protein